MALQSSDINDLNRGRIIESTDVVGQPGVVVLNADGSAVGASAGGATSAKQDTQITLLQGIAGMVPSAYDYISQTIGATSKTFMFKTGGAGGTTVSTITVNYTDDTLSVMSSVVKT